MTISIVRPALPPVTCRKPSVIAPPNAFRVVAICDSSVCCRAPGSGPMAYGPSIVTPAAGSTAPVPPEDGAVDGATEGATDGATDAGAATDGAAALGEVVAGADV